LTVYRAFRNTDPPRLADLWRNQSGRRGLMQPMSMAVLDRYVLSKPTFDRDGLIVAVTDERIVGFAHAGFGPSEDDNSLSTRKGVTSLVMVHAEAGPEVAGELLARAEHYLRDRGAQVLLGGGSYPLSPFYYGLYGGSELSGVLDSDTIGQRIFSDHGYHVEKRSLVLHRELASFRPVVDRQQMQIRRQTTVESVVDPPSKSWWEAVIFEPFERTKSFVVPRDGGHAVASVHFWNMETMSSALGVHAVGIVGLEVSDPKRRQGLAKFLLGESLRQLHAHGVSLAEVHVAADNQPALGLFAGLGFTQVDATTLYCKA
jgi:GNAT superfamily N-acetyltransferase